MKTSKEVLKEGANKQNLEEIYDIYTLNEKIGKSVLGQDKKKEFIPIDDIGAFYDQFRSNKLS